MSPVAALRLRTDPQGEGLWKLPGLRKTHRPPPRFPQPLGRRGADHSSQRPDDG